MKLEVTLPGTDMEVDNCFVEDNYFPSGAMPRNQDKGQGV